MKAFWQQGRLYKVNVSFLVDFGLLSVDEKDFCFSIPRHTCTNHQLLRKPISLVIKSVWTNVWFPALCVNTVILAVCRDFQCKILLVCEDYFLYSSQWEAPVQSLSWMHEGGASSTFAVCCQWYVPFDADFCDFLVYLLVTDKAVQLDRGFRLSSPSLVFRCPSCGQYCPFDDTSLELDWCFGNSISYSEILLQSEYQSILFQWNTPQ